ncbi:MAG: hypothetical protein WCK29_01670 [archaeon]
MALKAIKISEENYKSLVKLSASMQAASGEMVSIDKAISTLLSKKDETKTNVLSDPKEHHRHYVG